MIAYESGGVGVLCSWI